MRSLLSILQAIRLHRRRSRLATFATFFAVLAGDQAAHAQDEGVGPSAADVEAIARELSNPASSLAFLTFKNQYSWYEGDLPGADDQSNYTLLFQPVFPFPIDDGDPETKANIYVRPAAPFVIDQPTFGAGGFEGVTALGDIGFDVAYGVTNPNGWLFIGGMVGTLPTATDSRVAGKQLRLGPEALVGKAFDWGLLAVFPNHQWNVTGWSDSQYSTSQLQLVANFNLGDGWVAGSQPQMFYDWVDEQWTVPLNAQLSKTVHVGDLPVRIQGEINYYVDGSDAFRRDWQIGLNITPVVPNFINSWLRGQ